MLGLYVTVFVLLANILFVCAIYSCIKVRRQRSSPLNISSSADF